MKGLPEPIAKTVAELREKLVDRGLAGGTRGWRFQNGGS